MPSLVGWSMAARKAGSSRLKSSAGDSHFLMRRLKVFRHIRCGTGFIKLSFIEYNRERLERIAFFAANPTGESHQSGRIHASAEKDAKR